MTAIRPIANEQKESRRLLMKRNYEKASGIFHPAEAGDVRYVRIRLHRKPSLPQWHNYKGYPAWLMIDEITVK